jgi:hypothetical protein
MKSSPPVSLCLAMLALGAAFAAAAETSKPAPLQFDVRSTRDGAWSDPGAWGKIGQPGG